jgi:hypothetical protein
MLVLLAALVVGQLVQAVSRPYVEKAVRAGEFPVLAASVLAVALVLAVVVIVVRVRLGNQMVHGARSGELSLPVPESLPARYALADPSRHAVLGLLALVDVALLLLLQSTLRTPALSIADDYVSRPQATTAYVVVLMLVSLVVLVKLWRTGGPVLVLLLWWGLDRLVPTAGFLGARPSTMPPTQLPLPAAARDTSDEATQPAPASGAHETTYEPTVLARPEEPTVLAGASGEPGRQDATIVAPLDPTILARDTRQDMTIVAPILGHEPHVAQDPTGTELEGQTIVTRRPPDDEKQA